MITMFEATLGVLDQNNSIWSARAGFADAVTRARDGTTSIRNMIGKQQIPTTGVTEDKEAARTDLEDKLVVLANQVAAYAAKNGNHDLGARVEMTRSSVDRLSESDLIQTAQRVGQSADGELQALADYGVTAAEIASLNEARTKFEQMKGAPREAVVGRKVTTMSLSEAIVAVRSIFRNELDKLMWAFRQSNPDFFNAYTAARTKVVRAAARSAKAPETPAKPDA
jgi:hypothetical protein